MSDKGDGKVPDPDLGNVGSARKDLLAEVMGRRPHPEQTSPPAPSATTLPFGDMDPLVFERLVAEVAQSVYRLDEVQAYGRQGQYQAGLDVVGWKGDKQIVYQVRRIDELKPQSLESAVRDYTNPTRKVNGKVTKVDRPFPDADQFVLVAGCLNSDTAVTDKLKELKVEFKDDIEISLVDARALSTDLRHNGAIVAGYFGQHWASQFCNYNPPPRPGMGDGTGLLEDPIAAVNERANFDKAMVAKTDNPAYAASIFAKISQKLADSSLPFADAVESQAIEAFEAANDTEEAFRRAVAMAVGDIESCSPASESIGNAQRLAKVLDTSEATQLVELLMFCRRWFEHGFDVSDAVDRLRFLSLSTFEPCARVALLIAEMVITDEDDRDDHSALLQVMKDLPMSLSGVEEVRLHCAIADLAIMGGMRPGDAFENLLDHPYTDDRIRALVERRSARAWSNHDETTKAINAYKRSAMSGWRAGLGGDVRDALRSVAALSRVNPFPWQNPLASRAMASARSIRNREYLVSGKRDATVNALENICDNDVPDAVRWSHHWLRLERVSGGTYDEGYARRNYAHALELATLTELAVRQYINTGSRKLSAQAAADLNYFMDVSAYLSSPSAIRRACAADVIAKNSDFIPDNEIPRLSQTLADLFLRSSDPAVPVDSDDSIASLGALASFGYRMPLKDADRVIGRVCELIPREANQYRFIDDQLLEFLTVVATEHQPLRSTATFLLLEMLRLDAGRAENYVMQLQGIDGVERALGDMVSTIGSHGAASVLASWNVATKASSQRAHDMINKLMKEPLNIKKYSFAGGRACCEASAALRAAIEAAPSASDVAALQQPWFEHLLGRMNNLFMSADERTDAATALRFFIDALEPPAREEVFRQAIGLFDDPKIGPMDTFDRANHAHPLARFKLSDGGADFEAELLNTAAFAAATTEEKEQVTARIRTAIRIGGKSSRISLLLARTAVVLEAFELQSELAVSAEPNLRKAACVLWARSPALGAGLGEHLSRDPDRSVRLTLARELTLVSDEESPLMAVRNILKTDHSAQIRHAVGG